MYSQNKTTEFFEISRMKDEAIKCKKNSTSDIKVEPSVLEQGEAVAKSLLQHVVNNKNICISTEH